MKVIKANERLQGELRMPPGQFTGNVDQVPLHETEQPTRESFVHFEPGAHTHWHSHAGGQVIHILEGQARVQVWGDEAQSLSAGDTLVAAPGEKHWHGAAANTPMTQLAITSGVVTWLEEVDTE